MSDRTARDWAEHAAGLVESTNRLVAAPLPTTPEDARAILNGIDGTNLQAVAEALTAIALQVTEPKIGFDEYLAKLGEMGSDVIRGIVDDEVVRQAFGVPASQAGVPSSECPDHQDAPADSPATDEPAPDDVCVKCGNYRHYHRGGPLDQRKSEVLEDHNFVPLLPRQALCVCGHTKFNHVNEKGECRPLFGCLTHCEQFRDTTDAAEDAEDIAAAQEALAEMEATGVRHRPIRELAGELGITGAEIKAAARVMTADPGEVCQCGHDKVDHGDRCGCEAMYCLLDGCDCVWFTPRLLDPEAACECGHAAKVHVDNMTWCDSPECGCQGFTPRTTTETEPEEPPTCGRCGHLWIAHRFGTCGHVDPDDGNKDCECEEFTPATPKTAESAPSVLPPFVDAWMREATPYTGDPNDTCWCGHVRSNHVGPLVKCWYATACQCDGFVEKTPATGTTPETATLDQDPAARYADGYAEGFRDGQGELRAELAAHAGSLAEQIAKTHALVSILGPTPEGDPRGLVDGQVRCQGCDYLWIAHQYFTGRNEEFWRWVQRETARHAAYVALTESGGAK